MTPLLLTGDAGVFTGTLCGLVPVEPGTGTVSSTCLWAMGHTLAPYRRLVARGVTAFTVTPRSEVSYR